jgi:hypothetical protein
MLKKLLLPLLVAAGSVLPAQTKQETMDYIVRESMTATNAVNRSDNTWLVFKGTLYFKEDKDDVIVAAGGTRHHRVHMFPIADCDFYLEDTDCGCSLMAQSRSGKGIFTFITDEEDQQLLSLEVCNVINGVSRPKMEKLLRAFNHLIELETGHKDLF